MPYRPTTFWPLSDRPDTRPYGMCAKVGARGTPFTAISIARTSPALSEIGVDTQALSAAASPLSPELAAPVLQDLASRAARLTLALGRAEDSRDWAERGLALEGQPLFRANLLVTLADAEQKLGHADIAREHLVEALGINRDLLDQELEEP